MGLRPAYPYFSTLELLQHCPYLPAMPRPIQHPPRSQITLDGVLHALADPVRRRIVHRLLAGDGLNCRGACAELAPSTISFHHRVLREAGLIRSRKQGVEVISTVRRADLDRRFPGLLDAILSQNDPAS